MYYQSAVLDCVSEIKTRLNILQDKLSVWEKHISIDKWKMTSNHTVCELHFEPKYINETHLDSVILNGINLSEKRGKKKLTDDAVPTVFDGYPSYMAHLEIPRRKPPKERPFEVQIPQKRQKIESSAGGSPEINEENMNVGPPEIEPIEIDENELLLSDEPLTLFDTILKSPQIISRPNSNWHIHRGPGFMAYVHISCHAIQIGM